MASRVAFEGDTHDAVYAAVLRVSAQFLLVLVGHRASDERMHRAPRTHGAATVLRGRLAHIRAGHGSTTDRPRITISAMADAQQLSDAGVSEREAEVLALVSRHLTNAQIASRLFISVR